MSFLEHAQIMIPVLTGLCMTVWNNDPTPLETFEKKACFLPQVQTLYSVEGLLNFFDTKDGSHIYVLTDVLETNAVIFKVGEQWIVLGPYVSSEWQDTVARIHLAQNGAQQSAFLPYKTYRSSLPMIDTGYVIRTATMILTNTVGNTPPYELEMINVAAKENIKKMENISKVYEEIELVNRRYEVEQKLEETIRQGKTTESVQLWKELKTLSESLRFISDAMQDQVAGALGLRMLTRHAALRAGMTPMNIDAISQMYAQKMHGTLNKNDLNRLCEEYLSEFCAAIRATLKSNYSLYVKRAVQYIDLHLGQQIDAETLSKLSNISRRHFVQLFSKETGQTINQYVMKIRCERAADLLQNSPLQINEISRYVGYEDQSYFSRLFKGVMGVTPQEYRKMKYY